MSQLKRLNAESTTVTRDLSKLNLRTGNIYESLSLISARANQIQVQLKEEVRSKLEEFITHSDNLEEVMENREQIEISRFYERMPKPVAMAYEEWLQNQIYFRNETTGNSSDPETEA